MKGNKTLAVVHATAKAYDAMHPYIRKYLKDIEVINFMDEGLIREFNRRKELTPALRRRFARLLESADTTAPDLILIACTTFIPVVPSLRSHTSTRIITPYEAVSRSVVGKFKRVGLAATVSGAIDPAEESIREMDGTMGVKTEITPIVIDNAFQALSSGDRKTHDSLVLSSLKDAHDVDCVILCQFTLAHLEAELNEIYSFPVIATMSETMKMASGLLSS